MAEQTIQINTRGPVVRALIVLSLVLALVWSWFVVRWYIGDTLAEYLDPETSSIDNAKRAISLGPSDPFTHWRLADFIEKKLPPDQLGLAVKEYELAASLSPNDYRFWTAYGTALEQVGDMERAEQALRRAVELAPAYSRPRWYLGNLLLRRGQFREAFAELQRASNADPELRSQLFNLAWQVYKDDLSSLERAIGDAPEARALFAQYLLGRDRFDEGLRLWNTLTDTEKRANRSTGEVIIRSLIARQRFHRAISIWNDLAPSLASRAALEHFINGGFEDDVAQGAGAVFDWQVQSSQQLQIAIDPNHAHSGTRSLRLVFQVRSRLDSVNLSQLAPIKPAKEYEFECYVKMQKLETAANLNIAITDAADGSVLATSAPAPTGTNDWKLISLSFKTGPKAEAIIMRLDRPSCGENIVCPIFGTIWYDDFNLKPRN